MDDRAVGLYAKYRVKRLDGSTNVGGKHEHCQYFVLDLQHDRFAAVALRAYAESCREEFPFLACDLLAEAIVIEERWSS